MNVHEFQQTFNPSSPACVYLFCPHKAAGAKEPTFEPLLAERAVRLVVDAFVDPGLKDLTYSLYFADEADPSEIASVARTVPFLVERRVVVVQNAERYDSESAGGAILAYVADPCDSTIILFVANRVDRRLKFYKTIEKNGLIVECPEMTEREIGGWIQTEVKARGKTIESAAVRRIAERAGTRLSDVSNAITLICSYIGDAPSISTRDVDAACADVAEEEIWALTDAIASSDAGKAVRVLRDLIDLGKNEFEIMGSVNWLLKSAHWVAVGDTSFTRVKPFVANKVRPLAERLGREKLRDAFGLCMDTEILLRSTGVDRALALELLVIKLASATSARKHG